jgi:hypothetical protein
VIEVVTWDWREQPDQQSLAAAISRVSGGMVYAVWPETGDDQYALVLSDRPLTAEQALTAYRPRCQEPSCPDFGDPHFGDGTCPSEHADPPL